MDFVELIAFLCFVGCFLLLLVIAGMLYYHFHIKISEKKVHISIWKIYLKLAVYLLGIFLLFTMGKLGDDLIDFSWGNKFSEMRVQYGNDLNIRRCKQNLGIEQGREEKIFMLTEQQRKQCETWQKQRDEQREKERKIAKEERLYKMCYRLGFVLMLWIIHRFLYKQMCRQKHREK